ncbi:MAG: hypothetical protein ACRDRL_20215, partial [Sciscionella sp.]
MSGNTVARTLRRALVVTSGAALAVSLTGWGAVSATPVMPTQPGVATHAATGTFTAAGKFDAAARLLATAKTPRQRAALTDAALGTSANHLQQLYDTQPLYDAGIDGSATAVATVVSYGDKNIQSYIDSYDRSHGLPAADVQTITPAGPVPACGDPGASGNCPGWG